MADINAIDGLGRQGPATPRTEVIAVGTLGHVKLLPLKQRKTVLVQADLEVGDETFAIEIDGKVGELVAGMEKGSVVHVTGRLKTHKWKTQSKEDRERVMILAEAVSLIFRPEKRIGDG